MLNIFKIFIALALAVTLCGCQGLSEGFSGPPLAILTTALPVAATGKPYSAALAATGGEAPYTWALQPGSALPPGLTLSTAGVISGTVPASSCANGTCSFHFTVVVTDSESSSLAVAIRTGEGSC